MEKQTYYVNLHPISMDTISNVKVDDPALIQYEIEATEGELKELQHLLTEVQAHDMQLRNLFSFRHFTEEYSDEDRNEFQEGLNQVYEQIYKLGTPETKRIVEEIHLINDIE